ncbi:hemolysin family protein [Pseudoruegeria sp. SK021]|uniref:hemolysin family protein n=1 Tax=Pseudoruegeria sp. SK021 TaxID=1933035 RepID=UPI000A253BA8|nr:hemolysin family protein [Pseudoruegeria sp. SK021]OSP56551.1 magnesium/cobalt efflux protein [Pseudoruegeria sp. SK021]
MMDADGPSNAAHGAHSDENLPSAGVLSRFNLWPGRRTNRHSDAEIIAEAENHPLISGNGGGLSLSNLRRMRIADVATPKGEIDAVPSEIGLDDLIAAFRESGFTRLPVYEGTLDMPLGMVHLKDVAMKHGFNGDAAEFDMQSLMRPMIYAPPSMPIGVLLQKMQSQRTHMALVIDEYGGTDGLVTIEDLIEQVIGEIEDEHDVDEAQLWTEERPGIYLALARAPLDEFEEEINFDLSLPEATEDTDTLGGLVFVLIGRVPARGEIVQHPSGAEIEVVDADPRRIKRLRIALPGARPDAN